MSVRETLEAALVGQLSAALQLPVSAVYAGEQSQAIQRMGLEVWLEPDGSEQPAPGTRVVRYRVHLRRRVVLRPARTIGPEGGALRRVAEDLVEQLDGTRPFADRLPQLVGLGLSDGELIHLDNELDLALDLEAVIYV